jgi:hypothetical protein
MRTDNITSTDNLAVNTPTLMKMLNCGKPTAVKIGTEAGAKIIIGRKILWNPRIIRRYLDDISE